MDEDTVDEGAMPGARVAPPAIDLHELPAVPPISDVLASHRIEQLVRDDQVGNITVVCG